MSRNVCRNFARRGEGKFLENILGGLVERPRDFCSKNGGLLDSIFFLFVMVLCFSTSMLNCFHWSFVFQLLTNVREITWLKVCDSRKSGKGIWLYYCRAVKVQLGGTLKKITSSTPNISPRTHGFDIACRWWIRNPATALPCWDRWNPKLLKKNIRRFGRFSIPPIFFAANRSDFWSTWNLT